MIRYADATDYETLRAFDIHIRESELKNAIAQGRVMVMYDQEGLAGWLRYSLFWDSIPFMNMLYFLDGKRGKGYGRKLVGFWEKQMEECGYDMVLTSTLSSEEAQFFYRKLGYRDCGSLILPGEALEIILMKRLCES